MNSNTSSSIPNIRCLVEACEKLGIPYSYHDDNHNFISITIDTKVMYFANASTPWNDQSTAKICKDKEFSYRLMKGAIRMPITLGFLNPDCGENHRKYLKYFSYPEIADAIERTLPIPVIVKKNAGSQGANVFCCESREEVVSALGKIYDKNSYLYDYIALAQERVAFKKEFRVIAFDKKILLVYEKDISGATFTGNLSPLHQENSKAVVVKDAALIGRVQEFIMPIFSRMPLRFTGLDIMIDHNDDLWLIELNTNPGFEHFVKDNGDKLLVEMYREILTTVMGQ